jgi:hypothetical protein
LRRGRWAPPQLLQLVASVVVVAAAVVVAVAD